MSPSSQVYEYCKVDTECVKGTRRYDSAKCDVMFNVTSHEGTTTTYNKCVRDVPTPTVREDKSNKFNYNMRSNIICYYRLETLNV